MVLNTTVFQKSAGGRGEKKSSAIAVKGSSKMLMFLWRCAAVAQM
jgi:hypothetical protein